MLTRRSYLSCGGRGPQGGEDLFVPRPHFKSMLSLLRKFWLLLTCEPNPFSFQHCFGISSSHCKDLKLTVRSLTFVASLIIDCECKLLFFFFIGSCRGRKNASIEVHSFFMDRGHLIVVLPFLVLFGRLCRSVLSCRSILLLLAFLALSYEGCC